MEILNPNSLYKIKTVGLLAQHYEEFGMDGVRKFILYKLILKCHNMFYELKVEASEGNFVDNFKPSLIPDINEFVKEHKNKRFEMLVPNDFDVEKTVTINSNKLEGSGFIYDCTNEEFEMLDERYYHLAKTIL